MVANSLNRIGYLSCFSVALFNIATLIIKKAPLIYWFTNPFFFIVIGILLLVTDTRIIPIVVFIIVGIIMTFNGDPGDVSGAIYFSFAIYLLRKDDIKIMVIIIAIAATIIRGGIIDLSIGNAVSMISGFVITGLIFYEITKIKNNPELKLVEKITDDAIMKRLAYGENTKEIAYNLKISSNAINKRINKMRKNYNCKTRDQFLIMWAKSGKLREYNDKSV